MEKLIRYSTLRSFAYSNDVICAKPIRGIVVYFSGLGSVETFDDDPYDGKYYAEKGIIYLRPYNNPWAWMNRQASAMTDELIDILMQQYDLPADLPIVSTGKSMGGLSALVYMTKAKRTPVACVTNCPVCDLPFHFTERPDLPRTLYSAYFNEPGTMADALAAHSPLHLLEDLPNAEYHIFHCMEDMEVSKKLHSDVFVPKLAEKHPTKYYEVPDCGHCDLPADVYAVYLQCAADAILK